MAVWLVSRLGPFGITERAAIGSAGATADGKRRHKSHEELHVRPGEGDYGRYTVLIAGCATATPVSPPSVASGAASASADAAAAAAPTSYCVSAQLRLEQGPLVSEASQQHTLIMEFCNTAGTACTLRGYPQIQLIDARGARLALTYQHRQDQIITGKPPILVTQPPGGVAYAAPQPEHLRRLSAC